MAITATGTRTLFTDDLGQPLVGGQVYSYHAGTSELKDTYKDQPFTIPNSNPILLDDTGSADMYLKGAYRLRVLDSGGALVDEVDNAEQEGAKFESVLKNTRDIEDLQVSVNNINTKHIIKVDDNNRAIGHGKATSATAYDFSIRADKLRIGIPASTELGELLFTTYDTAQTVNGATIAAGPYLSADFIAKESITGDKIAKNTELNTPKLSTTYAIKTLDAPNLVLASDGTLKTANDPLNAASRKVGTVTGNLVERGADGYPVNNNAVGVGQTWQNVKASRTLGVNYTNSTGRPIVVSAHARSSQNNEIAILVVTVGGVDVSTGAELVPNFASNPAGTCVIPTGAVYSVNVKNDNGFVRNLSVYSWSELR